jgi:hypothetical protein
VRGAREVARNVTRLRGRRRPWAAEMGGVASPKALTAHSSSSRVLAFVEASSWEGGDKMQAAHGAPHRWEGDRTGGS